MGVKIGYKLRVEEEVIEGWVGGVGVGCLNICEAGEVLLVDGGVSHVKVGLCFVVCLVGILELGSEGVASWGGGSEE